MSPERRTAWLHEKGHMMVPSCSARLLYFFCSLSQKNNPANPNAMTAQLNPLLMGTNTVVKVHSMNCARGVMMSCVFMS